MIRILLLLTCFITHLSATLDYGGNTFLSLRQCDADMGRTHSLWYTHTTTDVGNPRGISVQLSPFVSTALRTKSLVTHFTHHKTNALTIASDRFSERTETVLPYHALHHDTASSPTEESATVVLDPRITVAGVVTSFFYDATPLHPGLAATLHIPVCYVDARLGQFGGSSRISDYFKGIHQQTSPIQASLLHGKLEGSTAVVPGPITAELSYNAVETARSYAGVSAGVSFALRQNHTQSFLLSHHTLAHDHHKVHLGCDAGTTLWHNEQSRGELLLRARYAYLLDGTENRIVGVQEDDGSIPAHSIYLLGAQKDVAGTFPLANILHRPVHRAGNHQCEASLIAGVTWHNLTWNLGYGCFARREETVRVATWDENTYAIAYPTYETGSTFANSETTQSKGGVDYLLNHRFITEDMLLTHAAQNPAQVSMQGFLSVGYHNTIRSCPILFGVGTSYEHSFVSAGPSMLSFWMKVAFSL